MNSAFNDFDDCDGFIFPVSHKHRDSAVWLMNHVTSWLSTIYVTVLSMLAYVNTSFSDRNVSVHYAGSQMSDSTRVCAYMYKTVEHLSIHNADDDESSEDYGAADVQVNILYHRVVVFGPGELSRYSDSLWAGRSGDRIPVGGRDFPHLWGPPSLLYDRYWVFPRGKASRAWH